MSIKARLFDQFRQPRGPLGILAGRIMSKRSSNQQRSAWTVELLNLHLGDRVLELGYGPGLGIEAALALLPAGTLVGLDHSDTMRKMATKRIRAAHPEAHPDLRIGDAQALPDDIGVFDKIFSCNVWLFWEDPVAVFENLREHLAQGGTIAVTHLPRPGQATRETSLTAAARITEQLTQAGYSDIRQELLEVDRAPAVCILAKQP
jgi:cyclopropane fatty-acyl-phospholipid synthase-like methyltransferase